MVNKVILVGNLGQDPEIRYTQNGTAVANFSMATTFKYKDNEETEWHKVVVWGRLAEICGEYLQKGSKVYVEGRIKTRKWEDRDGNERKTQEIVANEVKFLSPSGSGKGYQSDEEQYGDGYEPPPPDDDVPF